MTMLRRKTMHVYSRDGELYNGNIVFDNVDPMIEEEYDKFIRETLEGHFPELKDTQYYIIWEK